MSLLQQNSSASDDAARGESFTKGTSHVVWASIVAAILVTVAIAVYVISGQKPPVLVGQVTNVTAHFRTAQPSALDASGAPMAVENFEQVLLFAHVKLHNQSKEPLFMRHVMANVTLDDGIHTSYAATPTDYERLFMAYPELAGLHGKPLPLEATIAPGTWLEGDFVTSLRMTRQQWDTRKGLDFSFGMLYQPDMKIVSSGPVNVQ